MVVSYTLPSIILPTPVLQHIFRYLEPPSLTTCLRVSQHFYDIASDLLYHDVTLDKESFSGILVGAAVVSGAGSPHTPLQNTKRNLLAKVRIIRLTTHTHDQCETYLWATKYFTQLREVWVVREEISRWELKELCGSTTPCSVFHALAAVSPTIGFANIFGDEGMGVSRKAKRILVGDPDKARDFLIPSHDQFCLRPDIAEQLAPTPNLLPYSIEIPPDRGGFGLRNGAALVDDDHDQVPPMPLPLLPADAQAVQAPAEDEPPNYHLRADISVFMRLCPPLSPRTLVLHFLPDGRSLRSSRRFIGQLYDLFENTATPHIEVIKVLFTPMEKVRGMVLHPATCTCIACRSHLPLTPKGDTILMLRALRLLGKKVEVYGLETLAVVLHPGDRRSHRYLWGLKRKEDEETRLAVLKAIESEAAEHRSSPPAWVADPQDTWRMGWNDLSLDYTLDMFNKAWYSSSNTFLGHIAFYKAEEYRSERYREVGDGW